MTDASANTRICLRFLAAARTPPYFACVQRAAVKNRRATIAYYFSTDFRVQICFRVRRAAGLLSRRYINGVPRTGIYLGWRIVRAISFFFVFFVLIHCHGNSHAVSFTQILPRV